MSLVAAKCTECGANIEVDDNKDAGICQMCGTSFVTQRVVSNYNTYVTNNLTKNIFGKEKTEAEEYLNNGETFVRLKEWSKATHAFNKAIESNPDNWRGWFGMVKVHTQDFSDVSDENHLEYLNNARTVAGKQENELIDELYKDYQARLRRVRLSADTIQQLDNEFIANITSSKTWKTAKSMLMLSLAVLSLFAIGCCVCLFAFWNTADSWQIMVFFLCVAFFWAATYRTAKGLSQFYALKIPSQMSNEAMQLAITKLSAPVQARERLSKNSLILNGIELNKKIAEIYQLALSARK